MKKLFCIMAACLFIINAFGQEKNEVTVKTDAIAVTVFINGAQVTRTKTVDVAPGKTTYKFTDLSPYIDAKSIQVKTSGQVLVSGVNLQLNYLDNVSLNKKAEELTAKMNAIDDKLKIEDANLAVVSEEMAFLKENRNLSGKNQAVTLAALKETAAYYQQRISELKMKEIDIAKTTENLNRQKKAISNEMSQINSTPTSPSGEIVVQVESKLPSKCDFELSYVVSNAGWFPSYDVRAKNVDEPVELVYKANIHQNTKENWKNVQLKLSSSNPSNGSTAPQLQPYYLNYNLRAPRYLGLSNQVAGTVMDASSREPIVGATVQIQGTTIGTITDADGRFSLPIPKNNSRLTVSFVGYEAQTLSINSSTMNFYLQEASPTLHEVVVVGYGTNKDEARSLSASSMKRMAPSIAPVPVEQAETPTAVEFDIRMPYTIPSDNKNVTVNIESYSLDAHYEYYCVPKIDKDAFLTANITDWQKLNLLEGEANIFFENTFVGQSVLNTRQMSDTLTISLGRDKNVIVQREKAKDFTTRQFFGNKKEDTRIWNISVKNNKKQVINMNLFDQIPVSTNEEIEVTADNVSGATFDKTTGEVNWKFQLNPADKKNMELKYRVKYPKNKTLPIE